MEKKKYNSHQAIKAVAAIALTAMSVLTARAGTYTYHVMDKSAVPQEALAVPIDGQSAGTAPSLPEAVKTSLVSQYHYWADASCTSALATLPAGDADVYVTYDVNTGHRVKLDGSVFYNLAIDSRYYAYRADGSTLIDNVSNKPRAMEDYEWCVKGNDPYNITLENLNSNGKHLYFGDLSSNGSLSTATGQRLMLINGKDATVQNGNLRPYTDETFAIVLAYANGAFVGLNGSNKNTYPLSTSLGYNSSTGAKNNWDNGTRVFLVDLPPTYTYIIKDLSGAEAIAIKRARQNSGAAPVLPLAVQSSLVSQYHYWENAECTQELTALPNADANIYVTYDLAAGHRIKLDGSKGYNFMLHNKYYRFDGSLYSEGYTSAPTSNSQYIWYIEGNDPYDIKMYNVYNGTKYYVNFASRSGNATMSTAGSGHRLMLVNGNPTINDNNMASVTDQVFAIVLDYSDEIYNDMDERRSIYAMSGSSNNNLPANRYNYNKYTGTAGQNQSTVNQYSNGNRVYLVELPHDYTYHIIDNAGRVALSYSASQTSLGIPDYMKSPLAKNFTYYEENPSYPGRVDKATLITTLPDHDATILVRYEHDTDKTLTLREARNGGNVDVNLDLTGGTKYNLLANDRWYTTYADGAIGNLGNLTSIDENMQLNADNHYTLNGDDPYAVEVRSVRFAGQVVSTASGDPRLASRDAANAEASRFVLLNGPSNGYVTMVTAGSAFPGITAWDSGNTGIAVYSRTVSQLSHYSNGNRVSFSVVPNAAYYTFHVLDADDHSIEYIRFTEVREIGTPITLSAERIRPYCVYDGKYYTDASMSDGSLITTYDDSHLDIYYTFTLSAEGHKIFTVDESNPQWLYAQITANIGGQDQLTYLKRVAEGDNENRILANDIERVPDNAHQWALVGNPYLLHIMNREVNELQTGDTKNYAAMSTNPVGETRKFIDFKAGHNDDDWAMLPPATATTGNNSFVLRYHKENQDDPVNYYFSAADVRGNALRVDVVQNQYATLNVYPVEDYRFHVHKNDAARTVLHRTEAQPVGEPVDITPSSVLYRKYCDYSFYADWDEVNNVGINPLSTYPAEAADIHVAYTVSEDIPYTLSTDYEHAKWYLMVWDASGMHNYVSYNPGDNRLYKTGATSRPSTLLERDMFAFIGDPYDLKIINRKAGDGMTLGLDEFGAATLVKMDNTSTLHNSWQMTHTVTDRADTDPDRMTLFLRDGTTTVAGTRWYLSAPTSNLQVITGNSGAGSPFYFEEVRPMVNVTFHVYDSDHQPVVSKSYPIGYEVGTTITALNDELVRGLCSYTYFDDDTFAGTGSATLNKYLDGSESSVDIYAVYTVTTPVFTQPVTDALGNIDEQATFNSAKWFYIGNTNGGNFKYRHMVDQQVTINNNRIEADEKDPYLWAFVGDPYHVKVINLYSEAGAYLCYYGETTGSDARFDVPTGSLSRAIEWEIVPATSNGPHDFAARLRNSYDRDELLPKYFAQNGNFATLQNTLYNLRLSIPATFTFHIYNADDNRWVLDADLYHTYAVGDMVTGLPRALRRQYCSYEYYSEYNNDGVWDESKKFDTTVGAEATLTPRTVYVRYTVSDAGKALFSIAENPVWLNVMVNGYWAYDNFNAHQVYTDAYNSVEAAAKKTYQWRFEGDPYQFTIHNRRADAAKRVSLNHLPGVENDTPVGFYTEQDAPDYYVWAMKLTDNNDPDRFFFKLSDPNRDWVDTEYLRVYMSRDPNTRGLTASRNAIWAKAMPADDVVDITYEIRNENSEVMETRTLLDRPVGSTVDIDDRDKRYLVSAYHYYRSIETDESGARHDVPYPAGDLEPVSTYSSDMDSTMVYVFYDYERDKFSNDEGVFNWQNLSFEREDSSYWLYDNTNSGSTASLTTSQAALDDTSTPTAGIWALMGDPYRMRIVNFAYIDKVQRNELDARPGYFCNAAGFMVVGTDRYTDRGDGSLDHWPAYWQELSSEYPKLGVWEYLLNPANGKGYLALHSRHRQEQVVNDGLLTASHTVYASFNGSTPALSSGNGFSAPFNVVPLLKNVNELTYHVVIGANSLRPDDMPELQSTVYHYGVGNTLNLPQSLRRQYLKYHYWASPEDIGDPSKELKVVIDEWDQQIEDVYVTYEVDPESGVVFSTNTTDTHGPIWSNIVTGPGRTELLQDQPMQGVYAHYTNSDEHPTYDFWWAVEGDPYGFRLMNRYAADNTLKMSITDVTEMTPQVGLDAGGNARMLAEGTQGAVNVFEMIVSGSKGHFLMRPVHRDANAMAFMSTTNRIPVQLIREASLSTAYNHTAANWRFEHLSSHLKSHILAAGYGFGVDYDALYTDENRSSIERILDNTATPDDIERIENVMREVSNFPDDAGLREGYYRITPMTETVQVNGSGNTVALARNLFVSGYLNSSEYSTDTGKAGRLRLVDFMTNTAVDENPMFDPASIFHIKPIDGQPGHYTVQTQGLFVNETFMSKTTPGYTVEITDLGAGTVQIHTAMDTRGYLSYEYWNNGRVTHNFELNQHSATRLQDTKWHLQRVMSDEATLAETNHKNQMPLKLKLVDGGDDYYYSSLYVPYDVLLPEGAVAYTARFVSDDNGSRVVCRSVDYDNEDVNRNDDRYVPAGTPVVIQVASSAVEIDETTGCHCITMTLPKPAPGATLSPEDNTLQGTYLTTNLIDEMSSAQLSGKTVYVLGVSSKTGIGFYRNANVDPDPHQKPGNTYVLHNKAYYLSTPSVSSATVPHGLPIKMMRYGIDEDEHFVTGIETVNIDDIDWSKSRVFDIMGREVRGELPQGGVYLIVTTRDDGTTSTVKVRR